MMNAAKLWDVVGNTTSPDMKVLLEVGGDGAVHVGELISIRVEGDQVILSAERP